MGEFLAAGGKEAEFAAMDTNADGVLSLTEIFDARAKARAAEAYEASYDAWYAEEYKLVTHAALAKSIADMDTNGDGRCIRVPRRLATFARASCLRSHAGVIDMGEFLAAGGKEAEFAAMDTNADGVLSLTEIKHARAKAETLA